MDVTGRYARYPDLAMFYKCHLVSIVNIFRTGLEARSNKSVSLQRQENVSGLFCLSMWKYALHLVYDSS